MQLCWRFIDTKENAVDKEKKQNWCQQQCLWQYEKFVSNLLHLLTNFSNCGNKTDNWQLTSKNAPFNRLTAAPWTRGKKQEMVWHPDNCNETYGGTQWLVDKKTIIDLTDNNFYVPELIDLWKDTEVVDLCASDGSSASSSSTELVLMPCGLLQEGMESTFDRDISSAGTFGQTGLALALLWVFPLEMEQEASFIMHLINHLMDISKVSLIQSTLMRNSFLLLLMSLKHTTNTHWRIVQRRRERAKEIHNQIYIPCFYC